MWGASDCCSMPLFRLSLMYSLRVTFSIGVKWYTVVFLISMPGMRSILWSHSFIYLFRIQSLLSTAFTTRYGMYKYRGTTMLLYYLLTQDYI